MTSLVADARRRLEEHRAALERLLGHRQLAQGESAAQDLAETLAAIERIQMGSYGRCERCGGAIGRQRLLALPAARYCIPCASAAREG